MHRPKTERQALAQRLLGTANEPGPIDVGWLKARYGIKGSGISRWRAQDIPAAQVDDLEVAIRQLAGTEKEPPTWAAKMREDLLAAIREAGWTAQERAALRALDATATPTSVDADDPIEEGAPAPARGPRPKPRRDR